MSLLPQNSLEFPHFWYIIDPKVFPTTSNALICMSEGLLREINQY